MSKLRANQIVNKASTGAPTAPNGLVVTGVTTSTSYVGSGANLTALNATQLASGTIPDARFPSTLPAVSGANLTGIDASQVVKWAYNNTSTGYSISNTASYTDFTSWAVDITPASTNNRIMLIASTHLESRYNSTGGSGAMIQWLVSTDGGSNYVTIDNGNVIGRGWDGLSNKRVGSDCTLVSIHAPANTNQHRFRMRGRTGAYSNTEAWFGNSCDGSWWGTGQYVRSWFYAIEFKPNV